MKTCKRCGETRPLVEFYPDPRRKDGLRSQCKPCNIARATKWNKDNPARVAANVHRGAVKARYGITAEDYAQMLHEQGGVCAICRGADSRGRRLAVDHNHITGVVRALLCDTCNRGIGLLGDSSERLHAAARYLELHAPAHIESTDG